MISAKSLYGAWSLKAFYLSKDGVDTPWGKNTRGTLIYDGSGLMSVSINKDLEPEAGQNESEATLDAMLFYAARWRIDGNSIFHKVEVASNPSRVGRDMQRFAEINGDELKLTTPPADYGVAVMVWKRLGTL